LCRSLFYSRYLKLKPKFSVFMKVVFSLFACALSLQLFAQNKLIGIEDFRNPALQPKTLSQLAFRGGSDQFVYINDSMEMVQGKAYENTYPVVLNLKTLNVGMKSFGLKERPAFPMITWRDSMRFTFTEKNSLLQFDFANNSVSKVASWDEGGENVDFQPESGHLAFTKGGNLFVYNSKSMKQMAVSKDGSTEVVYGEAVHRSEFGINKGTFWSGSGNLLAFYRMDQSMVTNYPLVTYSSTPAQLNSVKYPMAGAKSHHVTVGVFNVTTNKIVYLQTGEPQEQYLTNVTWSPDEKFIYLAQLNRDQNKMNLCRYDVLTGKLDKMLYEETNAKYVEPEHGPIFIPNSTNLIVYSERDGRNNLYEYKFDGTFVRQVTTGQQNITEVLGFGKNGDFMYCTTVNDESPLENHCYYVNLKQDYTYLVRTTYDRGYHRCVCSKKGNLIIDVYSNDRTPYIARVMDAGSGMLANSLFNSPNPLADYKFSYPLVFQLPSKDGNTTLYNRMILPPDFDYKKKYPVMVYVYGGPHAQMIQDRWMSNADYFQMHMAAKGYIVYTLDNRGSAGRSFEFESATHRKLGEIEMEDQMVGINYLKKQTFVDTSRMGCFGWSFGGFMTTYMTLNNPGLFKASVAGGPVIDWKMYEIMYTERYMDTPEQNPEGYKNADLKNKVTALNSKLLLIHGQQDDVVLPQHSYSFVNECIAKGVLVDYFPYPNHPHNVRGKDRVHLYKKIADYFDQHLLNK
jgi:dipeptidyl-peptidase 4